jgi:peptidoglycan/LPS O-acetylase OafA/YrhL
VLILCFVRFIDVPGLLLANGLFDPLFGLIVFGVASSDWGLSWLLARRPVVLLGEASYALYLLHIPLWVTLCDLVHYMLGPSIDLYTKPFFVCFLAAALTISVLVFLMWERPARSVLRSLLQSQRIERMWGKKTKTASAPSAQAAP